MAQSTDMANPNSSSHSPASGSSATTSDERKTAGYLVPTKQVRINDFHRYKAEGKKFAMLTAYDYSSAVSFSDAGIELLLVGDSAANVVYGYEATQRVSMDEMCYLAAAVVRGAGNAFVVADLPFGTYEASDEQAVRGAAEMMHRSGAHAVKIEGGVRIADRIKAITQAGIPVCAHIGFTPQSVNQLSGFKVQGRGEGAEALMEDMQAVVEAGADMVVMEMVPAEVAKEITAKCPIPTIGIGAGPDCDGQVLVWHDLAAFPANGHRPKFAKQWAEVGADLTFAASEYKREVAEGTFPAEEHCF